MDRRRPIGVGALLLGLAVGCGVLAGRLYVDATTSGWTYRSFAYDPDSGVTSFGPTGAHPGAMTEVAVVVTAAVVLATVGAGLMIRGLLRQPGRPAPSA